MEPLNIKNDKGDIIAYNFGGGYVFSAIRICEVSDIIRKSNHGKSK